MRGHRLHLATLAAVALAVAGCRGSVEPKGAPGGAAAQSDRTTVVYVMRHAEKAMRSPDDEDPPLSAKGNARAQALAERLKDAGVNAIYVTQYRRTHETAAPLARARSLTPQSMLAGQTRRLVDDVLQHHRGEAVLIVGHSNTVPEVITALGVQEPVAMDERDYGDLFVVKLVSRGPVLVTRERVGD